MTDKGKVYLVGAGPGDPDLLTQKAVALMHSCDVVCYDLLIDVSILALIPAEKALIPVGYRGYCGSSVKYGMHPLVLEQALAGKNVLRLKAGDPFIFGRGTEECRCLIHHGIEYEVVPGITSALGAAAYTGFPLTSAGIASDVIFATGHRISDSIANWAALGDKSGTLVLYMGAKKLQQHADSLIAQGKNPDTPVAVVAAATSYKQRVLISALTDITEKVAPFDNGDPMLVVIGQVVGLAEELDWRTTLPLHGKQVIACSQNEQLIGQLKSLGAIVINAPQLQHSYAFSQTDWQQIQQTEQLWFSSAEHVRGFAQAMRQQCCDIRNWKWLISGTQSACEQLAQLGLFAPHQEQPPAGATLIGNVNNQVGITCQQTSVIPPQFELQRVSMALIDNLKAAKYLHSAGVLEAGATILTNDSEIQHYLQEQGYSCVSKTGDVIRFE